MKLFTGWPLPAPDYDALIDALGHDRRADEMHIGHSLGAVSAMDAAGDEALLVLLAPSVSDHRIRHLVLRLVLAGASRLPSDARTSLERSLRFQTYRRYRAVPPPGQPLGMREAAHGLAIPTPCGVQASAACLVIVSPTDQRAEQQLRFARRIGATVAQIEGGHLFPIANPAGTAATITAWADSLPGS